MTHEMSPEAFTWQYALGCLESRYFEGTLSKTEYKRALGFLRRKETPPDSYIRKWFPKPFTFLEHDGTPCTLEEMQHYWRVLHKSEDQHSPVIEAIVSEIKQIGGKTFFVWVDPLKDTTEEQAFPSKSENTIPAINFFEFDIDVNDRVMVHNSCIAEVL